MILDDLVMGARGSWRRAGRSGGDDFEVVILRLAPLLLGLAGELFPVALDAIAVNIACSRLTLNFGRSP
jgi:hypothetical protein